MITLADVHYHMLFQRDEMKWKKKWKKKKKREREHIERQEVALVIICTTCKEEKKKRASLKAPYQSLKKKSCLFYNLDISALLRLSSLLPENLHVRSFLVSLGAFSFAPSSNCGLPQAFQDFCFFSLTTERCQREKTERKSPQEVTKKVLHSEHSPLLLATKKENKQRKLEKERAATKARGETRKDKKKKRRKGKETAYTIFPGE